MLLTARIPGARRLPACRFRRVTADAYARIAECLAQHGSLYPTRFWNFIPRIRHRSSGGLDRYMVFNAGRFTAYADWPGPGGAFFGGRIPTASAVGHGGDDLIIHTLALRDPGHPVENPRQTAAIRYSARFGPLPPAFSRATLARLAPGGPRYLMVGGTASVVGEDSCHHGNVRLQTRETLRNLSTLLIAAIGPPAPRRPLDRFRELLVYHADKAHREIILDMVRRHVTRLERVETMQADLCRSELLVEIEGLALAE